MKNKPVVLIVSRRLTRKNKPVNWVSEAHLSMLMQQGIVPVIVPIVEEALIMLEQYTDRMCGLLMVEGGDIMPEHYGGNKPYEVIDEPDALKDTIEISVFKAARKKNAPILGFCRGIQLINVLSGGTVSDRDKSSVVHMDYDNYDGHRHAVNLVKETPLYDWYKQDQLMVNSYHHQGIDILAPDFEPMAHSEDGLIEGIYNTNYPFMVGLQFHPERMLEEYTGNLKVFEAFGDAVKEYSKKNR